jgi:hypothetical protein
VRITASFYGITYVSHMCVKYRSIRDAGARACSSQRPHVQVALAGSGDHAMRPEHAKPHARTRERTQILAASSYSGEEERVASSVLIHVMHCHIRRGSHLALLLISPGCGTRRRGGRVPSGPRGSRSLAVHATAPLSACGWGGKRSQEPRWWLPRARMPSSTCATAAS